MIYIYICFVNDTLVVEKNNKSPKIFLLIQTYDVIVCTI